MRIFVAASYSSQVNYETGEVYPKYQEWLEGNLNVIEGLGHTVFCALRADGYRINDADPAEAFSLDVSEITKAQAMVAFVDEKVSAGVQTEIGYALALRKPVILAHEADTELAWFNQAMLKAGKVDTVHSPLTPESDLSFITASSSVITVTDFIRNWGKGARTSWNFLYKEVVKSPDFPLQPDPNEPSKLVGDLDQALAWIDTNKTSSVAYRRVLERIKTVREELIDA